MSAPLKEIVQIGQVGAGLTRRLVADGEQRRDIAKTLRIETLHEFAADIAVVPWSDGVELRGHLRATMTRLCGITLEPLEEVVDEAFTVQVVPSDSPLADSEPAHDLPLDSQDPPDVAEDGRIDLAAYAVEHLGLAMDPFPRKPGAEFEATPEPEDFSPFAALRRLKDEPKS